MYIIRKNAWKDNDIMFNKICFIFVGTWFINWILQFCGLYTYVTTKPITALTYVRTSAQNQKLLNNDDNTYILTPVNTTPYYISGWIYAMLVIVIIIVLWYCYTTSHTIGIDPEYCRGGSSFWFLLEMLLFAGGVAFPYLYAVNNRRPKITTGTWMETFLLFAKFSGVHLLLQYTGFYESLGL